MSLLWGGGVAPHSSSRQRHPVKVKFSCQARCQRWHQALPGSLGTPQPLTNTRLLTLPFPRDAEQLPCSRRALLLPSTLLPQRRRDQAASPRVVAGRWKLSRSLQYPFPSLGTSPGVRVTHRADAYQQLPVLPHRWGRARTRCYQLCMMSREHRRASS